ncbi:MAG: MBL fold metallo-hydrolase [Opitutaceae bacterium]|nr:MBL fold metallo-hydrolase [Opitutaceae bacterium]
MKSLRRIATALLIAAALSCGVAVGEPAAPTLAAPSRAVAPTVAAEITLAPDLHLLRLGAGAYLVRHVCPFVCNSVLVEMPDGTFVFGGTPGFPNSAQLVLDWIVREHGPRPVVAVNTGYHFDNLGGNAAFRAAGFPVHGSDLTVRLLAERGETMRALTLGFIADPTSPYRAAHAALQFVPPDHVYPIERGLTLHFGGEEVRVLFPGPTQAPDKVAIYFPDRRLLYGSCLLLAGDRTGNIAEADLGHWPEGVRQLMALPIDVVVAAHGPRLDPGLLQHTLDVLARHATPSQP